MEMLWMAEGEDKFGGCEIGAREREERGGCSLGLGGLCPLCRKEGGQRPRKSGMESRTYGWAEGEEEEEVARSLTGIPQLGSFSDMLVIIICDVFAQHEDKLYLYLSSSA